MRADRKLRLLGYVVSLFGAALVFAALFSHSSRVFAVDHLAGTEHADLMVELSAATPAERWLLTAGTVIMIGGLALVLITVFRWAAARRELAARNASR